MWSVDGCLSGLPPAPSQPPQFGIIVEGKRYVDVAHPFSYRTSGVAFFWVTKAVTWLMRCQGFHALVYVDDFVSCETLLAQAARPSYRRMAYGLTQFVDGHHPVRPLGVWVPGKLHHVSCIYNNQ